MEATSSYQLGLLTQLHYQSMSYPGTLRLRRSDGGQDMDLDMVQIKHVCQTIKNQNKTKVLSVQLGKTLCLTKYPLQRLKKALKSEKKNWFKSFVIPSGRGGDHQGGLKLWGVVH